MTMFKQTYADLVKLTKDQLRDTFAPMRAREMRLEAQTRVAKLESQIAEAEQKVVELGSTYPINFDAVLEAMDSCAILRRRQEQFNLLIKDLFPVDTPKAE